MRAGWFIPPEMNNEATNNYTTMSNAQRTMVGKKKFDEQLELGRNPHGPRLCRGYRGLRQIKSRATD